MMHVFFKFFEEDLLCVTFLPQHFTVKYHHQHTKTPDVQFSADILSLSVTRLVASKGQSGNELLKKHFALLALDLRYI